MPYSIVDYQKLEDHITFIRINPNDIALTLREVLNSLSDLSWISSFDADYIRGGFDVRANDTIKYIKANIIRGNEDRVTESSGEYIVSELARKTIVNNMDYLDIPLAELIKIKDVGNHGFDFYSKNKNNILLFGEAKYLTKGNAYGKAFSAIVAFEKDKQDISDIVDIDRFCCDESKSNVHKGRKGFMAAFAAKTITTDKLVKNMKRNRNYQFLNKFEEIICVAVNI